MSATVNAKTYTADSFSNDRVVYIGANKTVSTKDDLTLSRVRPVRSNTFSGHGKTTAKLNRTALLTDALSPTGELSIAVIVLNPVGAAAADVDTLLNDMGAYVSSAAFKTHVKSQQVNF